VPGLRRSEVASLAGISAEYMAKLERGNATGVSGSVIDGLAHALQLDEAERTHLQDLLRTADSTCPPRRRPARQRVRPTIQRILDSMTGAPAFVLNGRLNILAANDLGLAQYSPIFADPARPANIARLVFLVTHAAAGVDADVVCGPAPAESVAAGGQLPDQVRQVPVVGGAAGLGAQQGDGVHGLVRAARVARVRRETRGHRVLPRGHGNR
jgi:transcriptional regulator with XRE-family HTH domain